MDFIVLCSETLTDVCPNRFVADRRIIKLETMVLTIAAVYHVCGQAFNLILRLVLLSFPLYRGSDRQNSLPKVKEPGRAEFSSFQVGGGLEHTG